MLGHHAAAFITDTCLKGYRDFDVAKAYAGMKKNATQASMIPWHRGPVTEIDKVYLEQGFFPALARGETETVPEVHPAERRQAVTVTLETCYDDWCLAQLARDLGKQDDYEHFMRRARNYAHVYNPDTGWMAPRSADGKWVQGFDPKLGGGQGGRDWFTECNGWTFAFHVQHDPAGLIALMGGPDRFAARLDALFTEQYDPTNKYTFLAKFPDMTGLIGMYAQGNEPSFHIPFLYNHCGRPWQTQRRVRQILDVWYGDGPLGICGDEDGGALSSWYVFAALGFYPLCPGNPTYEIASPLFEQSTLTLANGKSFTIKAKNTSAQNKYIQSARLNGQTLHEPRFPHAQIAQGGTLELTMGPRPNQTWGVTPPPTTPPAPDARG
jgi:predicted alpha-1,2-mannosidase